jgi:hypothetical protein
MSEPLDIPRLAFRLRMRADYHERKESLEDRDLCKEAAATLDALAKACADKTDAIGGLVQKLYESHTQANGLKAALAPFALLHPDANMNDPLRKWFSVANLASAHECVSGHGPVSASDGRTASKPDDGNGPNPNLSQGAL